VRDSRVCPSVRFRSSPEINRQAALTGIGNLGWPFSEGPKTGEFLSRAGPKSDCYFPCYFRYFFEFSERTFLETLPHLNWFRSSLRLLFFAICRRKQGSFMAFRRTAHLLSIDALCPSCTQARILAFK
jgi:hypothetical protein